jgi:hypothetical protein
MLLNHQFEHYLKNMRPYKAPPNVDVPMSDTHPNDNSFTNALLQFEYDKVKDNEINSLSGGAISKYNDKNRQVREHQKELLNRNLDYLAKLRNTRVKNSYYRGQEHEDTKVFHTIKAVFASLITNLKNNNYTKDTLNFSKSVENHLLSSGYHLTYDELQQLLGHVSTCLELTNNDMVLDMLDFKDRAQYDTLKTSLLMTIKIIKAIQNFSNEPLESRKIKLQHFMEQLTNDKVNEKMAKSEQADVLDMWKNGLRYNKNYNDNLEYKNRILAQESARQRQLDRERLANEMQARRLMEEQHDMEQEDYLQQKYDHEASLKEDEINMAYGNAEEREYLEQLAEAESQNILSRNQKIMDIQTKMEDNQELRRRMKMKIDSDIQALTNEQGEKLKFVKKQKKIDEIRKDYENRKQQNIEAYNKAYKFQLQQFNILKEELRRLDFDSEALKHVQNISDEKPVAESISSLFTSPLSMKTITKIENSLSAKRDPTARRRLDFEPHYAEEESRPPSPPAMSRKPKKKTDEGAEERKDDIVLFADEGVAKPAKKPKKKSEYYTLDEAKAKYGYTGLMEMVPSDENPQVKQWTLEKYKRPLTRSNMGSEKLYEYLMQYHKDKLVKK